MIILIILEIVGPCIFMATINAMGLMVTDLAFWLLVLLYAVKGAYFFAAGWAK